MFEVLPSDIDPFGGDEIVELLRRLIYAEAQTSGVPLFNVAVPLQITLADGGEDARVEWAGGEASTLYFPHRHVVFQSKATDTTASLWKRETWTKASQRKGKTRVLNDALVRALAEGAAYIGVTATGLVGAKPDERKEAIREGIREAGGDPDLLHSIHIYDGNLLAEWANRHHAVALWIKEQKTGLSLSSFATLDQWGRRSDMAAPPYVVGERERFSIGSSSQDRLSFDQFSGRLVAHLLQADGHSARITGPSGLGKSRSVFEAMRGGAAAVNDILLATAVFCDFREVSGKLWDAVNLLADGGSPVILVVDECPRDDAKKLHERARATGSRLRVVTLDTNIQSIDVEGCLTVGALASDDDLIKMILSGLLPKSASRDDVAFVADLCAGYPRIAVLTAQSYGNEAPVFKSVEDVAKRILAGANIKDRAQVRALECLSLFDGLAPDVRPAEFDHVAQTLGLMTGDEMYEHLVEATDHGVVGRYGDVLVAQPRPIANYLAAKRLAYLRPSVVLAFLQTASDDQRESFLGRVRYLSRSTTLRDVAIAMMTWDGELASPEQLFTRRGSEFVAAFVHVIPDFVSGLIARNVRDTSLADLGLVRDELGGILDALERLAHRPETFPDSARSLLRLSAANADRKQGRATEITKQLFQLFLSGTAAIPAVKYAILDEALANDDPAMLWACARALEGALETERFYGASGYEQLGDLAPIADWKPATTVEATAFNRNALDRLLRLRRTGAEVAADIDQVVAEHMRQLLIPDLFEQVLAYLDEVRKDQAFWPQATKKIGDWLYFDRREAEPAFADKVRALYDASLPTDIVDRALFFSQFWPADIRDPDHSYNAGAVERDYEFSGRESRKLALLIAQDPTLLTRAVQLMATRALHSPYAFADELAKHVGSPEPVLAEALAALDASGSDHGLSFVRALLRALEAAFPEKADVLIEMAKTSRTLGARELDIYASVSLTGTRIWEIAELVRTGRASPSNVVPLSYGRSLDAMAVGVVRTLIEALHTRAPEGGAWAAIEILSMYLYGRSSLSPDEAELVKDAVLAPLDVDEIPDATMSAHAFGVLIKLLDTAGFVDAAFAGAFGAIIVAACQTTTSGYRRTVSEALQEGLMIVIRKEPEPVWSALAAFYEVATRAERSRLYKMTSLQRNYSEQASSASGRAGILFETPIASTVAWADVDPARRAPFLVSFTPLLDIGREGLPSWHSALVALAKRYGKLREFRSALAARIFPSSWSGSLSEYLEPYIAPLEGWTDDADLGPWALEILVDLKKRIAGDRGMRGIV